MEPTVQSVVMTGMKDPVSEMMESVEEMEPMKESEEMIEPMEGDVEAMKEIIEITESF